MSTLTLLSYKELPSKFPEMKDNPYIFKHYRCPTILPYLCLRSSVQLHNETVNIWTHFFPSAIAVIFMYNNLFFDPISFQHPYSQNINLALIDRLILNLPLFGNFLCFGISAVYHCLSNHSKWVASLREMDLLGIAVMNTLHSFTLNHFKFYHDSLLSKLFNLVSILTLLGFIFSLSTFRNPNNKSYQVSCFALLVVLVYSPAYISYNLDLNVQCDVTTVWMISIALAFCALGGVLYATKFPEVVIPGCFDLIGNSHNLMHVCAAIGMFLLYEVEFNTAIYAYKTSFVIN